MPTDAQVDRALELIQKSGGNYQYFFEKLSSPAWIEPLAAKGRFDHPPAVERLGTMYRYPRWPEGEYLRRMATRDPEAVAKAIHDAPFKSDNPLVHQLLIEIGTLLPGPQAAHIARKERTWLDRQTSLFTLYPEKAGTFVVHLCDTGEAKAALELTTSILEVRAPAEREGTVIEGDDGSSFVWRSHPDPLAKMDTVWSQLFIRQAIEPLAFALPTELLSSLAQNLDSAVSIHAKYQQDRSNDYSDTWRPHIEHSSRADVMGEIVNALIESIKAVLSRCDDGVELVFASLAKHEWPIFDRIRAFTLLHATKAPQDVLERFVEAPERYARASINPEFSQLLTKVGASIRSEVLQRILGRIDAGPDPASYAYHLEHRVPPEEVVTVRGQIIEQWKRDWLFPLAAALDENHADELNSLVAKYDAPRPRIRSGGARVVQDLSPTDVVFFNAMSVPQLIEYLKGWVPPDTGLPFERPSRAGMASTLRQWVDADPQRASENLEGFLTTDLDPGYITAIFDAFTGLLKTEKVFDVVAVARAAQWVAENTDALMEVSEEGWAREATWNWAQMSSARYLTDLMLQEKRLDLAKAGELWPAVRAVSYLARPTEEDETEYKKEASRYASYALNTPRPVGLEAVIRYGRWLKLATPKEEFSMDALRSVFTVLEEKVDPNAEPSVAVREMFGMQFRALAWLDLKWFCSVIPKLFPGKAAKNRKEKTLDRFAWNAYLQYGGPVLDTVPVMRERYLFALSSLNRSETEVSDLGRTLGSHIMQYYAHGAIELDDLLMQQFFTSASLKLRAQALGDIGWNLSHETSPLDETAQQRLMQLLDSRMPQLETDEAEELDTFGWWLGSGKFPPDWSIQNALRILERTRSLRPDFAVVEELDRLAENYPFEAVKILHVLFEEDHAGWAIHGWGQHIDSILKQALEDGEKARAEATSFVELLVARGFRSYRGLIGGMQSGGEDK
jgi:hypothetical protein